MCSTARAERTGTPPKQVAYRFVRGDELDHAYAVRDHLVELVAEVQSRFARMATLDDEVCPESKITPAISRDPNLGMPITAVIIDEVHVFLENPTRDQIGGKKTTLGDYIADLLTYLVRKGPAAGIVVILATQRPDSTTIPSRLRAVLGSRFALRVMDWRDSNIVLGEQMNTRGYDASTLLPSHKGVGILRPDGETDAGADVLAMTVRTYYMPNPQWREICARGRALRESAGTLAGHAAGDDQRQAIDPASVVKALGAGAAVETEGWSSERLPELPEPLASVVDYLGDDLSPHRREFVPTAEIDRRTGHRTKPVRSANGRVGMSADPPIRANRRRRDATGTRLPHDRHPSSHRSSGDRSNQHRRRNSHRLIRRSAGSRIPRPLAGVKPGHTLVARRKGNISDKQAETLGTMTHHHQEAKQC